MIYYWFGIFYVFVYCFITCFIPFVDYIVWNELELANPFFDVHAERVVVVLLGPGVEDAEVRRCIGSIAHCPLPPPAILHRTIVHQLRSKVAFSLVPVQKQILSEEGSHDHAASVVHKPGSIELPHGSINNGKPSSTLFPSIEMLFIVFPLDLIEFRLEGVVRRLKHSLVEMCDIDVEISPVELVDDIVLVAQMAGYNFKYLSNGHWCEVKVSGKGSGGDGR